MTLVRCLSTVNLPNLTLRIRLIGKTSGVFQHPAVLGALQDRLNSLVGKPSSYIAELGPDVKRRLNALLNIQDKHSGLEAQFRDEILALEKKYLGLYQPLYDQ
ncbi:Nucleosome assembly protein 1-like 1, partial [Chytridiales sp. JEL 0842]